MEAIGSFDKKSFNRVREGKARLRKLKREWKRMKKERKRISIGFTLIGNQGQISLLLRWEVLGCVYLLMLLSKRSELKTKEINRLIHKGRNGSDPEERSFNQGG